MNASPKKKNSLSKTLSKEIAQQGATTIHEHLTRVGGWGAAGLKKDILDILKKTIQHSVK